ncbi:CbiX/SirB N-terminal domain-containing protein [Pseudophaeobacter flagellatus]|uniref:CbiX/SirB N-terminal domain-containing protein n=1 Tax=Pseudophaeobacter flagellatus TaxID=2899119 RepID=UPI001E5544A1|nr:CbiX/SirB N-terminal domain-containing protein [Pseudophaeobacter flagellatus]
MPPSPRTPADQPLQASTANGATKTVVIVAHGQPSAPEPPERALAQLAAQVSRFLPGWEVRSATLAQPDRLEQVMRRGALVYPFFMADGWFTTKVLPQRLNGLEHRQLPPFGQDPALPELVASMVRQALAAQTAAAENHTAQDSLLLAAHGSAHGPKASAATERFATALRPLLPGLELVTSYIEQPPYLSDVAKRLPAQSLCLPFFAQSGDHVTQDIPAALTKAKFEGRLLPALGTAPKIAQLIAEAIRRA